MSASAFERTPPCARVLAHNRFSHNSLLIFNSISTPTLDRFSSLTHYAVSISVAASALMAVSGYLTFGQDTLGNILNCFPTDDIPATVARLCFGLNMCTTFPLEAFGVFPLSSTSGMSPR